MTSIDDIEKRKRGRPPTDATPIMVRVSPALLAPLDAWISDQRDPKPSRPEAVRRLVAKALGVETNE